MKHLSTFDEAEADFNKIVFCFRKKYRQRKKEFSFFARYFFFFCTFVTNLVKFLVKSGVGHKMIQLVKCQGGYDTVFLTYILSN